MQYYLIGPTCSLTIPCGLKHTGILCVITQISTSLVGWVLWTGYRQCSERT